MCAIQHTKEGTMRTAADGPSLKARGTSLLLSRGKLTFKGEKPQKKKKSKSRSTAGGSTEDPDAHLEGWLPAPSPSLLLGPSYITLPSTSLTPALCVALNPTTAKVYPFTLPTASSSSASSSAAALAHLDPEELEALVDSGSASLDPTDEGPSDVHHVWVCTRIPDTNDKVTFRSGGSKFLGADEYGAVFAEREARGLQEEWTLEETGESGRLAVKSSYGKYLSVDVVAGGKIELRADEEGKSGPGETERFKILMQGEFVAKAKKQFNERNGIKTRPDNGLTVVTDLAGAELDNIRKYHHHAKGSDLVGTADDTRALKKARKEGNLAEAMLDRRRKLKSDRYC
ncbi:hypothetical protein JCM11251_001342 [Rhodosporidiobolus azoricus]